MLLQPVPDDLHQVGPIHCAEEIAVRLHQASGIDPADSVKRFSEGRGIPLYLRFTLSLRDVEDLLAERGVPVSYETVRRWVNHFGPMIAADLRKRRLIR